ncbi:MAG: hypothetical protein FJ290_11695 [Planctomycetes bacterium]|nr:hypothetical protein [Planctomycetota bacterium]
MMQFVMLLGLLIWQDAEGQWVSAELHLDDGKGGEPLIAHLYVERTKGKETMCLDMAGKTILCRLGSAEQIEIDHKTKTYTRRGLRGAPERPGAEAFLEAMMERLVGVRKLPAPDPPLVTDGKLRYQRVRAGGGAGKAELELLRSTSPRTGVRQMTVSLQGSKTTLRVRDLQFTEIAESTFQVPPDYRERAAGAPEPTR